jgi:hypothetical protein
MQPVNPTHLEPYNWAEWAAEHHMYDTPDNTWVGQGPYDIIVTPIATDGPWMRLGMLQRIYGDTTLHAQEN